MTTVLAANLVAALQRNTRGALAAKVDDRGAIDSHGAESVVGAEAVLTAAHRGDLVCFAGHFGDGSVSTEGAQRFDNRVSRTTGFGEGSVDAEMSNVSRDSFFAEDFCLPHQSPTHFPFWDSIFTYGVYKLHSFYALINFEAHLIWSSYS